MNFQVNNFKFQHGTFKSEDLVKCLKFKIALIFIVDTEM